MGRGDRARTRGTFETLISWVALNAGGIGLAVGGVPQATCRACDLAPVVLALPGRTLFVRKKLQDLKPPLPEPCHLPLKLSKAGLRMS
jgi:hypothetical protein